ncbi:hypothetical protein [Yoonia vestfoldensis]|uniref:hypothetical protein n=1 Tax=Yoonia vestfoldensis TaxID=245188 RepID=UPI0012FF96C4|nr:hypothetical protein [Yoonia vestfoldensis]
MPDAIIARIVAGCDCECSCGDVWALGKAFIEMAQSSWRSLLGRNGRLVLLASDDGDFRFAPIVVSDGGGDVPSFVGQPANREGSSGKILLCPQQDNLITSLAHY